MLERRSGTAEGVFGETLCDNFVGLPQRIGAMEQLEVAWGSVRDADCPLEGDGFEPSPLSCTHRPLVAEGNAVAIEWGSLVIVVFLMRARGIPLPPPACPSASESRLDRRA